MIIIICMATLITVLYGPTFGSLPQSARYPDLRPLANPFAAALSLSLSLSLAMNSPSDNGSSRAHFQSRDLMRLHEFGLQRVPLYNPHRTR